MTYLRPVLYSLGIYGAYSAGSLWLRTRSPQKPAAKSPAFRLPHVTLVLLVAVGVPTTLQFFFPIVVTTFQRDPVRFVHGELWRIITPLFVQDGGIGGAIFNLVSFVLVGSIAEQVWSRRYVVVFFFIGGIVGQVVAFAWQPYGAGNSVANFSLAASIAVACLLRRPPAVVLLAALLALGADGMLIGLHDIHGAAALAGAIAALGISRWECRNKPQST